MSQYFVIYKPFGVLSQFSKELESHVCLADHFQVPKDVYPLGRLDKDSEGLLILSNDKRLNHRLLDPKFEHEREYWVQVEGVPDADTFTQFEKGIEIRINKKTHACLPAKAKLLENIDFPDRDPPVRFRKSIPTTWISLCLKEGKNRQVRKMTAKLGYPTLRLIRGRIESLSLGDLKPGDCVEMDGKKLYALLKI